MGILRTTSGLFQPRLRSRRAAVRRDSGRPHVLVTGAAGLIGGLITRSLADTYEVHGLDVLRGEGVQWVADLRKRRQIEAAFAGMESVVDLAADANPSSSWQTVIENNVASTLNAFEAARLAGVKRVVYASSNHVVGMYERDEPYASVVAGDHGELDPDSLPRLEAGAPIRPDGPYGVGKALGEAAARLYSDEYDLSVICLRIGSVNQADRPTKERHFATLLTHRDLAQLVRCCLTAPDSLRFGIFYGVSANTWRLWDIEAARRVIGYQPHDNAESWR